MDYPRAHMIYFMRYIMLDVATPAAGTGETSQ